MEVKATIPTLPGTSDIPVGPERPEPVINPPTVLRSRIDDLEDVKRAVEELRVRIEGLETRVARLESGTLPRIG